MSDRKKTLFIVWKAYQRRVDSISDYLDLSIVYYHYHWEEKSKWLKALSYILKSIETVIDLIKYRPAFVFVQLPPTPVLYLVGIYCAIMRKPYVADCHNAMFLEWWINWPLAKYLLRKASAVIVHNKNLIQYSNESGIQTITVRDPLPLAKQISKTGVLNRFNLKSREYMIVPWNLASDEPIEEFIEAVKLIPERKFAMTWFYERLPEYLKKNLPDNLIFTDYLEINEFNDLFANAGAAISLTDQQGTQPSAAAEAIAFDIPIVLSDTETARNLYKNAPVFVHNDRKSIANGILEVFNNHSSYELKVKNFKYLLRTELEKEVDTLKTKINWQT